MLAIFRVLRNLRDKEHYLRTRYHREHPHFLLYIALDAIITVAIFGGSYAIASTHGILDRNPSVLADLGAKQLTATELVSQVRDHGVDMYWVGPVAKAGYSSEILSSTKVTVNYLAPGTSTVVLDEPFLSVETYNNPSDYAVTAKGPLHPSEDVSVLNSFGDRVTYNPTDLCQAVVEMADGSKLVVIRYSDPPLESSLLRASEKLHLIA
jgi:hypothetical protein